MNALLSFLYALVQEECAGALEGVGLDPQVGYLHGLRPGPSALALDLMEELRPLVADRLAVTLTSRRQFRGSHFDVTSGARCSSLTRGDGRCCQRIRSVRSAVSRTASSGKRSPLGSYHTSRLGSSHVTSVGT